MDGTIIDSEPYWMKAEHELVEEFGGSWSMEQAYSVVGSGLWNTAKLLQAAGVDLPADDIVSRLSQRVLDQVAQSVPWRPGVRELFRELLDANVPCALVTMSLRANAEALAAAVEKELGQPVFRVIVAGDDVAEPKPHPEAYLRGAELLGVDAVDCIALEDSGYGAGSSYAAGAVTVGIPLHVPIPTDVVHELWESLEGNGLDALRATWHRHRGTRT
jgi:HAD superfamily hydrolase (TIGR01509 family)